MGVGRRVDWDRNDGGDRAGSLEGGSGANTSGSDRLNNARESARDGVGRGRGGWAAIALRGRSGSTHDGGSDERRGGEVEEAHSN